MAAREPAKAILEKTCEHWSRERCAVGVCVNFTQTAAR
jgi:hypothetical protein